MTKFLAFLFVTLFVVALAGACGPPGQMCTKDSECCSMSCNPWANRCIGKMISPQSNGNGNGNPFGFGYGYIPQIPWKWQWQQAAYNNDNAGIN